MKKKTITNNNKKKSLIIDAGILTMLFFFILESLIIMYLLNKVLVHFSLPVISFKLAVVLNLLILLWFKIGIRAKQD